jgi:hypothetical protein
MAFFNVFYSVPDVPENHPLSLRFQRLRDLLGRILDFPGVRVVDSSFDASYLVNHVGSLLPGVAPQQQIVIRHFRRQMHLLSDFQGCICVDEFTGDVFVRDLEGRFVPGPFRDYALEFMDDQHADHLL